MTIKTNFENEVLEIKLKLIKIINSVYEFILFLIYRNSECYLLSKDIDETLIYQCMYFQKFKNIAQ